MNRPHDDRNRERDEIERADEAGDEAEPAELEPIDAGQQDFGTRNVIMTNSLQGGASPAAGGVIATGGELGMQPTTDDELVQGDEDALPPHERR